MSEPTPAGFQIVLPSQMARDLRALGVAEGQTLMLHASVRAVGWVVGGPDVIIQTLLNLLGPKGTLAMYVAWEESENVDLDALSEADRQRYLQECPPFDPQRSRANRAWSILTEYLRTWPGASRSDHPTAGFAAVGGSAEWITADHPLNYGYGWGSPFDKIRKLHGKILLLGSPLGSVSMLHYAEHISRVPNKRVVVNTVPMLRDGKREVVTFEEFDTGDSIRDRLNEQYFPVIMHEYMAAKPEMFSMGTVGAARSYLFDVDDLVQFAVAWMERTWGRV